MTNHEASINNAARMPQSPTSNRTTLLVALCLAAMCASIHASPAKSTAHAAFGRARLEEPLVEIGRVCPGVVVELRYATERNITGHPIYPPGSRARLRKSVAERLNRAQQALHDCGFNLKVWDAYRPEWAQRVLWNAVRDPAYVVEPSETGSLHGWGMAVDVTLVDFHGREVRMPTDFDAFSPAARSDYEGQDPEIASNLWMLEHAMARAGFRHIRDEWWHYSVANVLSGAIDASLTAHAPEDKGPKAAAGTPAKSVKHRLATTPLPPTAKRKSPASHPLFPASGA
jgi:D-alanyl-D-alanine dipeptidase